MRTYKEPKRIDKARVREPGLVAMDEGISKLSALTAQVEDEDMDESSEKEEEIVDEDMDLVVQENNKEDNEDILESKVTVNSDVTNEDENIKSEADTSSGSVKKKTPPKKLKKVVENNFDAAEVEDDENKKEEVGSAKSKGESQTKSKKNVVKEAKKRKIGSKKKEDLANKSEVVNHCVVDLGRKDKISQKSKMNSKVQKSKEKQPLTVDIDISDSLKDESEKSGLNSSDSLSISPRSSKRTPVRNRKYQSDDEFEFNKEETDSSGKKKRSRSKSPRCSTPKKRKLDFDENEFMSIKDDDLHIKNNEMTANESNSKNSKKVVKSPKSKLMRKEDIILKPKAVKKKNKVKQNNEETVIKENDETMTMNDKDAEKEETKDENVDESSEPKNSEIVKEKKKRVRKKKVISKKEVDDMSEDENNDQSGAGYNKPSTSENLHDKKDDGISKDSVTKKCNDDKQNNINDINHEDDDDDKKDEKINTEQNKTVDGEKKEKRKMKPLEEIVCTYCKKVSVGKAANTRHLKKCYVYQAKLEMQRQASENGESSEINAKKDESIGEIKDVGNTSIDTHIGSTSINKDESKNKIHELNGIENMIEENQNEDKENLDNSFTKLNESVSSENKSDIQGPSRKKSKPDVIYNCQHCEFTANKKAVLARHLHLHSIYMCLRCNFFSESDDDLKDHMHREHKDRMDHKLCRKCSRYIHCADISLEQHMENCQGPVPFKCPHCEKEFKYESSLKSHVVKHDPDGPKKFSCPQCSYKSNYKANLKKHLVNIHSSRIKQFKCTYEGCEKMFHSEDNMRRHLKWHKIEKSYKCRHCDKVFRTTAALSDHAVVHNAVKPFKCTLVDCDKAFRSLKLLKNHLQDFHNQAEKKFVCEHPGCDFAFFKRSHLDRHLVTHSGERKFGCSYCGKGFRHADNLRVHLRQHTNEKPVSCNMCDFKCRQKSSLRYHLQKIHNVEFKKREKRKMEPNSSNDCVKSDNDKNSKTLDSSMEMIIAVVNAVAKYESDVKSDTEDKKEKLDINSESISAITSTKPDSSVSNKVVDLYEFKSDDEFGDDSVLVPLPLPVHRPVNHITPTKTHEKVEIIEEKKEESKDDEQTDTELDKNDDKEEDKLNKSFESNASSVKTGTPKPKTVRRGKKKKINYAEPETDLSFETVDVKEDNKDGDEKQKPVKGKKRGPKPKSKVDNEVDETKETKESDTTTDIKPKGKRGRKKVEKIPKKRGRKPKNAAVEEKPKSPEAKPQPKKKKLGRPRKVRPPSESEDEKKEESKGEESNKEDDENDETSDKDEDRTIPGTREEEDETLDVPVRSPPKADDDDDTREYGDESLRENAQEAAKLINQHKEESDEDEPTKNEDKVEVPPVEIVENIIEKQSENDSDKMSSGIDTDFEDDLKPPPAPRPPPVIDSDEADIESGPDDMDTPGRDFESTPPKSNLTEHIHSVPAHTPRDFESSPPKSVQTSDYGPSTHSQTGFESRREGDSVEAMSSSYNATPSREVSIEEKPEEKDIALSYTHLESETIPDATSPVIESIQPGPQSNGNADYGSQSESTMPEVDKEYLGQYLQQFDSVSRSEDERLTRMNSQTEQPPESISLQNSPEKDLPPLNLSANAPPLNLSTSSNDRENSQGSDMSNKRMEILSIDRQQEDHFSGRSESVSRSSDRIPDNVYESISSMNTFLPPTTRETPIVHSAETPFPSVSTPSTFMRFSENDAILQRQRMTTPFLPQGDPNALQSLHRMADNALAQHNNASLLRRPTTVPPREDMFSSSSAAMAQTIARNPFHNSWASQEVRPAHWSQNPYLGRSIERPSAATSASLFGKDNYLTGREFMFDTSRRSVTDRNVFPGLPQTQRPELAHDTFPMERFDISYFSGHTYPGATSLTDYNRAAAAHTSQKSFDERYRQSSTGITEFRALPQTTASSMFSSNMLNSSFHLDKYMYPRDPVYHAQHIPDAANSPFLPPGVPGQHSVFDRDYTRGYFQNSPYSLDKQYAAAAAASAKLSHPSGASVVQDRDFVPRPGTAAATGENQVQDAYRHPMLYNMMNHRFYE